MSDDHRLYVHYHMARPGSEPRLVEGIWFVHSCCGQFVYCGATMRNPGAWKHVTCPRCNAMQLEVEARR